MIGLPSYSADFERQYTFTQIGTITSAQTALAVTARDNASVVSLAAAKKVIWSPDEGTAAAILRFRSDGSGTDDANVIEMYAAKGADYYTRIATLTTYQGDQDWSGGHFIDKIVMTNEAWAHGIRVDTTTNEIGRVLFNTGGFDRFLFIVSTKDEHTTTIHVDIARLDKQFDYDAKIHSTLDKSLIKSSTTGGIQKVALTSNTGNGSAQACRMCWVKPSSANTAQVHMTPEGGTADVNDFPLDDSAMPISVDNCSNLYFYSTDADAVVYILWLN